MRILAIGIGGAGGRIVNQLYQTDRRSSKVACVQALAVDVDADAISRLTSLPESSKIFFPPVDISPSGMGTPEETATIDIAQIIGRIQTMATGETDAIVFCIGLGGSMVDTVPPVIAALRQSVTEPIFALVTLPCLVEGERCSSKAADDIETISQMLDGIIVFDNETWNHKVKTQQMTLKKPKEGLAAKLGWKKREASVLSPREMMYSHLNDAIVRRISLILRAGEFRADGGLDLAEVVLDAGEVLNTMRGMGFITIGYAVEQLPSHPLDFLARLRPAAGLFSDDQHKKASRIVDLAKQAIYQEISAPCDITSAHKALVLIAGPSHELSMKGFMTVRKWIDRSIAGLETRSGDYPIMSTRFIAIIIMLSGLENIPRITELKEIRTQYRARSDGGYKISPLQDAADSLSEGGPDTLKDEMIVVPGDRKPRVNVEQTEPVQSEPPAVPEIPAAKNTKKSEKVIPPRLKVTPIRESAHSGQEPVPARQNKAPDQSIQKILKTRQFTTGTPRGIPEKTDQKVSTSEQDRRKIEQELLKQRRLAVQRMKGKDQVKEPLPDSIDTGIIRAVPVARAESTEKDARPQKVIVKKQVQRTVIVRRKPGRTEDEAGKQDQNEGSASDISSTPESLPDAGDHDMLDSWIRQVAEHKKDPDSEEARSLQVEETPNTTRDDALLHTNLKRDRKDREDPERITGIKTIDSPWEMKPAGKKRDRIRDDEDLSWVE